MGASIALDRPPFEHTLKQMKKSKGLLQELASVVIEPKLDLITPLARHFGAFQGRMRASIYFIYGDIPLLLMAKLCANVGLFGAPDHRLYILVDTDVKMSSFIEFPCGLDIRVSTRVYLRDQLIESVKMTFVNRLEDPHAPKGSSLLLCANCSKMYLNPLRKCARCKVARYCSKECQKAHWKSGHKSVCAL